MKKIISPIILLAIILSACDLDYERSYIPSSTIQGIWNYTYDVDSSVLVLSLYTMKEYIYERRTGKLLERIDYGDYKLFTISSPKGKFEDRHYISLEDYDDQEDYDSGYSYWSRFSTKNDTMLYIYKKHHFYKKVE